MKTAKQLILTFLADGTPKSIEQVHKHTGILRPSVRRVLGQSQEFQRVAKGVYTVSSADGKVTAYIQAGKAEEELPKLQASGMKFDAVFLDPAYYSRALIGGNRGIKDYGFIMPPEWAKVVNSVAAMMRTPDSHVYLMLSGAHTAQKDMVPYLNLTLEAGLKLVHEGTYTKTFKDGKPVTNVRGEVARPERLLLLTLSGEAKQGEEPIQMNLTFQRPKGYQTEKAAGLLRQIIKQATKIGDMVGDFFGGSGVTAEQSIIAGRSITIMERTQEVVDTLIVPRVQAAINSYNQLNPAV